MRGHEHIIAMRMSGTSPEWVFINDYPSPTDWHVFGDHPTVCTHDDVISRLDLRFIVGLKVSISSTDEARAKALFDAAQQAGSHLVGACHVQPDKYPHAQDGWACVWEKSVQTTESCNG
jgi:hypothetical protein